MCDRVVEQTIIMARPSGTAPNFASPKGEGFQPSPKGTLKIVYHIKLIHHKYSWYVCQRIKSFYGAEPT